MSEAEELAQKLADHFSPPYEYMQKKQPIKDYKDLPFDERYEVVERRSGPDNATMVVFKASDGFSSVRSLTYLEVVEAVLKLQGEQDA